ncbi:MAG: thioredoxin domain-containing protein, partial [Verrucomicrobiales bacterium]|nr:thioredoxin domain-containing protein [Verrucomicrobiales bacterium]
LQKFRRRRASRIFLHSSAVAVIAAASWFFFLQIVEWQFCPYCATIHVAGLVFAFTILKNRPRLTPRIPVSGSTLLGLTAVTAMAVAQLVGPQPATHVVTGSPPPPKSDDSTPAADAESTEDETKEKEKTPVPPPVFNPDMAAFNAKNTAPPTVPPTPTVTPLSGVGVYLGGQIVIDPSTVPYVGDPAAPHTITKFFDYTCRSCRDSHGDFEKLLKLYPGKFRVLLIPCPLDQSCNPFVNAQISANHPGACELAILSLSVWFNTPEKFPEYHDFLMAERLPINLDRARKKAESFASSEQLDSAETSDSVESRMDSTIVSYSLLRQLNLTFPKILLGEDVIIHGTPRTSELFLRTVAKHFALPYPPAAGK